jgi:hypothetical protein
LVEEFFGRPLHPEWIHQPDARSVFLEFFRWKIEPFRSLSDTPES